LRWLERARSWRQPDGLGERMLNDMGISRADAECEARKPFWRP
jgi:uncharacterized protein YjiS (DUF1127 family)